MDDDRQRDRHARIRSKNPRSAIAFDAAKQPGRMPLDVRLPISGLFAAVGLLLLLYGALVEGMGSSAGRLNAGWGAVMIVFAAILGYYGLRGERGVRASARMSE